MWLPDGEKFLKVYLCVTTEYTNLTDGQTLYDGVGRPHALMHISRGKNRHAEKLLKC